MDNYKIEIRCGEDYFAFALDEIEISAFDRVVAEMKTKTPVLYCYNCGDDLELLYCNIIDILSKKNLLPDDFKPWCCDCY